MPKYDAQPEDYALLADIALDDVQVLKEKGQKYGTSWKAEGGFSAYFNTKRKWDRFENIVTAAREFTSPTGLPVLVHPYDVFNHGLHDDEAESLLDTIKDLRCYLLLCEGEIRRLKHARAMGYPTQYALPLVGGQPAPTPVTRPAPAADAWSPAGDAGRYVRGTVERFTAPAADVLAQATAQKLAAAREAGMGHFAASSPSLDAALAIHAATHVGENISEYTHDALPTALQADYDYVGEPNRAGYYKRARQSGTVDKIRAMQQHCRTDIGGMLAGTEWNALPEYMQADYDWDTERLRWVRHRCTVATSEQEDQARSLIGEPEHREIDNTGQAAPFGFDAKQDV